MSPPSRNVSATYLGEVSVDLATVEHSYEYDDVLFDGQANAAVTQS